MAGSSLLVLIDDIAAVLDDVSLMTKVAAKKTAGVLGDDLAVNAEKVTGVRAERELPVVWAVAKGSFVNKLILVPAALVISFFAPWLITPALMLGAFAERMRFGPYIAFITIWLFAVYVPLAHMVWGGGWIGADLEALDFAGGLVVHMSSGFSALVWKSITTLRW